MKKWKGWIAEKRYYKVYVEADDWLEAKERLAEASIDHSSPHYIEWDIYDIDETMDEENES